MANMKEVNGVIMPCTAEDEAYIAKKESDFLVAKEANDKVAYLNKRKEEYPSVEDQLLSLWSAMDSGEIPQAKAFYSAIKAVNEKYPAPV